jgi:hypothetical protein
MMTSSNSSNRRNGLGATPSLFDTWLQTRLQRLYDEALEEPLPDDLLRLLPEPGDRRGH